MGEKLQAVKDWLYVGRKRAIALGFTHEARFCGIPHWCVQDAPGSMNAMPKLGLLELYVMGGITMHQWLNDMFDQYEPFVFTHRRAITGVGVAQVAQVERITHPRAGSADNI